MHSSARASDTIPTSSMLERRTRFRFNRGNFLRVDRFLLRSIVSVPIFEFLKIPTGPISDPISTNQFQNPKASLAASVRADRLAGISVLDFCRRCRRVGQAIWARRPGTEDLPPLRDCPGVPTCQAPLLAGELKAWWIGLVLFHD